MKSKLIVILFLFLSFGVSELSLAQNNEKRIEELEKRVSYLEQLVIKLLSDRPPVAPPASSQKSFHSGGGRAKHPEKEPENKVKYESRLSSHEQGYDYNNLIDAEEEPSKNEVQKEEKKEEKEEKKSGGFFNSNVKDEGDPEWDRGDY